MHEEIALALDLADDGVDGKGEYEAAGRVNLLRSFSASDQLVSQKQEWMTLGV